MSVTPAIRPVKIEPMIERAVSVSPARISPLACNEAILAETAVPVGDLSTFPGLTETAFFTR